MHLALFFTRGLSVQQWIKTGLFQREILLYQEHLNRSHLKRVYWLTYGNHQEEVEAFKTFKLDKEIEEIIILGKPGFLSFLPDLIYSFVMPFYHWKTLRECQLLKSNQMDGAWSVLLAKIITARPFYLRTGFTWSLFEKNPIRKKIVSLIELFCYKFCDFYAVSSREDYEYVEGYRPMGKGILLRNFIDLKTFSPRPLPSKISFVCVARFNLQKNLENLVLAFKDLPYPLTIIGEGELKPKITELINSLSLNHIHLQGKVKNDELPGLLSRHSHFILVSHFEGNPKALLEAMSLGMICVTSHVPGIREIIEDGKNGFLSTGIDSDSIRQAVLRSIDAEVQVRELASQYVGALHSIDLIVEQETRLFQQAF